MFEFLIALGGIAIIGLTAFIAIGLLELAAWVGTARFIRRRHARRIRSIR